MSLEKQGTKITLKPWVTHATRYQQKVPPGTNKAPLWMDGAHPSRFGEEIKHKVGKTQVQAEKWQQVQPGSPLVGLGAAHPGRSEERGERGLSKMIDGRRAGRLAGRANSCRNIRTLRPLWKRNVWYRARAQYFLVWKCREASVVRKIARQQAAKQVKLRRLLHASHQPCQLETCYK